MFSHFRSAWQLPEVRKKLLVTLLLIVIYRLGVFIPVPGVNPTFIAEQASQYDFFTFLNMMSGRGFDNYSIFALGITPYINASIIVQLLTVAIPALENLSKEGEMGRKKIEKITRLLGVVFALIMSIGFLVGMGQGAIVPSNVIPRWLSYLTVGLVVTAGTAFLMWIAEQLTESGIGNGSSFIIFVGIVSSMPGAMRGMWQRMTGQVTPSLSPWVGIVVLILAVAIVLFVTLVDLGERRIPVQYSKRVVGRKMYGGQSSFIPVKVNSNGVLPLIFAITIMQLPGMIAQLLPNSGYGSWYMSVMGDANLGIARHPAASVVYVAIYALLIVGFSYFYNSISFNPIELSKNIQGQGGYIPGIRPGKPTSDYLGRISHRLTLFSAVFLALIAAIPTLFSSLGASLGFGATSLLIMVSVALETDKAMEAQVAMRHYKGFLR